MSHDSPESRAGTGIGVSSEWKEVAVYQNGIRRKPVTNREDGATVVPEAFFFWGGVEKGAAGAMGKVSTVEEPVLQADLLLRMSELLSCARERSMRSSAIQEPEEGLGIVEGYRFRLSPRRYFTAVPTAK